MISLSVSGTIFFIFVENWSVLDAFYFSVTTLTTVGFRDPGPTPAPELLDATLRVVGGTVLLSLVGAVLTVLYLIRGSGRGAKG